MIVKFVMWSPFHYFMIIFPFVLALILYYLLKHKSEREKRLVSVILAIIMVLILIMRNVYIWITIGTLNPEVIPFQICHIANFVFLAASLSKNKIWSTIGWCLNFPAGLVSVIFADGLMNYETMINIQAFAYIAGHMLIVTIGLYMLLSNLIKIDWNTFKKSALVIGLMYILSIVINNLFNGWFKQTNVISNYFYSIKPENGTPLETLFNLGKNIRFIGLIFNPIYLISLSIVGYLVLLMMFGIYQLRKKLLN